MTFYRNFIDSTRPFVMATAAGLAISIPGGAAKAQENFVSPSSAYPKIHGSAEPGLLPIGSPRALPMDHQAVQFAGGRPSQRGQEDKSMMLLVQNETETPAPRHSSFAERFGRIFRSKPTTPPVDPGMSYPKASESVAGQQTFSSPPPAPGASGGIIPSIPPTYGATAQQPALFQAPSSANAIGSNDIPSSPMGLPGAIAEAPAVKPAAPGAPLQNIPALKELMAADEPQQVDGVKPDVVSNSNLPKLDFNAPIPAEPAKIAPGEPTAQVTAQATAQITVQPKKSKDPFADLFPEDQKSSGAVEQVAKQESTSPYTGQSLDADAGKEAMGSLPPPPAEEQVAGAKPPELQIPALPEAKTAGISTDDIPAVPPAAPPAVATAMPSPDLSLPSDPPKLSADSLPEVKVTASTSTATATASTTATTSTATTTTTLTAPSVTPSASIPPSAPAAPSTASSDQEEQKSKMEMIAARKHLKGLKGFCPVTLREDRDLVDSSFEFMASYNGQEYTLCSAVARDKFLTDPAKYAPAEGGCDVIHLALTGEKQEGSLDHAVWYKGRLYLFNGVETMETFVAAPSSHASVN